MIHGTSIEATLDMLEHGKLRNDFLPSIHKDYLYFYINPMYNILEMKKNTMIGAN